MQKPATLDEAIEQMVAVRLEAEKEALERAYKEREQVLLEKLSKLEESAKKPPSSAKKA